MTARARYDAASAHATAMRDIAGKLRALIVALGDDGARLAAAYREVAAAEAALADDAAKAYADVPRAPTTDADRERVVQEVRGAIAERRPCAGWHEQSPGRWWLDVGPLTADASGDPGSVKWSVEAGERSWARGSAPTLEAAQLAAEDSLRAIAAEILRAVGS